MDAHDVLPVARKRRTEWPESVRLDPEIKQLDEEGEWIICRTCTELYEKTKKGRRPNDPHGFKVKMNAKYQEAAWVMHKSRVVAHRGLIDPSATSTSLSTADTDQFLQDGPDDLLPLPTTTASMNVTASATTASAPVVQSGLSSSAFTDLNIGQKRLRSDSCPSDLEDGDNQSNPPYSATVQPPNASSAANTGPFFVEEMKFDGMDDGNDESSRMNLPKTGWRCPGIVPDSFYEANAELVHAFAKYYIGSYRINVVRDIRTDKVMLFSHDCENQIVYRERPRQSVACEKCYNIWSTNKSFKRILKKMDRYSAVEDILRQSWSLNEEQLMVLSHFKHSSSANLSLEGRKLKQAALTVLKRYPSTKKMATTATKANKSVNTHTALAFPAHLNHPEQTTAPHEPPELALAAISTTATTSSQALHAINTDDYTTTTASTSANGADPHAAMV